MSERRTAARRWLLWFGLLVVVGAILFIARARLDKAHVTLAFLLVVLGGSAAGGRALGISLAGAAFLLVNWFFLPPYNTLIIADPLDWLVLFAFLITGVTAAQLLERQRHQAVLAEQRASEIDRIATLGAENLNAPRAEDALDAIAMVIRDAVGTEACVIYLRQAGHPLRAAGQSSAAVREEHEAGLLAYVVDQGAPAAERADGTLTLIGNATPGRPADMSLPGALTDLRALGVPLSVRGRVVGALRLSSLHPFSVSHDQRRLLEALAYYAALGAERVRLAEAEEEAESLRRADRLKDSLLAAVSHDLRTPLTAIKGIANEVWRGGDPNRAQVIEQEADRLTSLVDDLLELSQLNAGILRTHIALNTVDDVIGAALERVERPGHARRIEVEIANDEGLLVGLFDFSHTVRALTNLLENALKYSPSAARVKLRVSRFGERLLLEVEDRGPGIADADAERIFEPFYRGRRVPDGVRGTGLGLSIARQLAEVQHGTLTYSERPGGGSRFVLTLPAGAIPNAPSRE